MIAAFLSDIHGNLPAFKAALSDARKRGADKIYCAGDLTGYGPFPEEVCRLVMSRHMTSIIGNYDMKVLAAIENPSELKSRMKPGKWKILEWTAGRIGPDSLHFLSSLPSLYRERLEDRFDLLMSHGSPVSPDDTIYPSVTPFGLNIKLDGEKPDVLVCGHTHIPFAKRIVGTLVVNCGSAGLSVDGDPRPSYALVNIAPPKPPTARIVRFDYPKAKLLNALEISTLPKNLSSDFVQGNRKREMP